MHTFNKLIKSFKINAFFLFLSISVSQGSPFKVSVIQFVEHPALSATYKGFLEELNKQGYREGQNLILSFQSAQGNAVLAAQIAQNFISNKPDIIVAISTIAAQAALAATKGSKIPIVFSSVTDPITAKLVINIKVPKNITGVSNFVDIEPQLKLFKKVLPSLKTLGIIYNSGEANSTALNALMEKAAKKLDLKLVMATATKTSEVLAATRSLCGKADAIFINNDNTALVAFKSVMRAAQECGMPAFVSDIDLLNQGALAALGPDQVDIGRQTARMVDIILKNPTAPLPPVEYPKKTKIYIKK